MLVDVEVREALNYFCLATHQTQERAVNQAVREMLERAKVDSELSNRIERARVLKEQLRNL
jgi:hypothetical protein